MISAVSAVMGSRRRRRAAGVSQDLVDGLMHGPQVDSTDRAVSRCRTQQVKVPVKLADHVVGQRLSQLFLVDVFDRPVAARGWSKRVGHLGQQRVGAAVLDHLAEHPQQLGAVGSGVRTAVGAALLDDGPLDQDEVTRAQAGRVGAAAGHQGL